MNAAHRAVPGGDGGAFHIGAGWYGRRGADGSVTLLSGVHQEEITIPAKIWSCLVASLSKGGYSDSAVTAAVALHQGG